MTTPACGKHTQSDYNLPDNQSKRKAPSRQQVVRPPSPPMGYFEQLPIEIVEGLLDNVSVRDLSIMRLLNKDYQATVDDYVHRSLDQLIQRSFKQDSDMHRLGRPHDPTIKDPWWNKLRELCQTKLQFTTRDLQTTPLSTLFSPEYIDLHLQNIDQATIALKKVLCESSPDNFSTLQPLTEVSHIRTWLKSHPDVLDTVTELNLSKQNLLVIPHEISLFSNLERLYCEDNPIDFLDHKIFDKLTHLQELFLHHTRITEIPPGLFDQLTNLQRLTLNDTGITEIPPGLFDQLTKLQGLFLHHTSGDCQRSCRFTYFF
jgi:hypothetical protein